MRQFFLTDEQLWRAIAKNTAEVSNLMGQEVEPVAENGADKNVVRRARLIQFNKLQREYRVYTAELRRRYS
jgi:hypothetical protein